MIEKKFLDQTGVQFLWSKISMGDYPNNQDLTNVINAIDETKADKGEVATAESNAKSYTDAKLSEFEHTVKVVTYNESKVAEIDNQVEFTINLSTFDINNDSVEVYSGRTRLSPSLDYIITGNKVILNEGLPINRTLDIKILKNVFLPEDEALVSGNQILPGTIPLDRLSENITMDKVFIKHDVTGELYKLGLDDNGLYYKKVQ